MSNLLKNGYFLFILLFSGLATSLYRSQDGIIVLFFVTSLMMLYFRKKITKKYFDVLVVWLVYSIAVTIVNRYFNPFFIFRHIVFITTAYTIIMLFKEQLFVKFEKLVYFFALISLFFFIWQLFDFKSLYWFMSATDVSGFGEEGQHTHHNFLYTLHHTAINRGTHRNAGFTWEPGPFSIYLTLAIYFNLMRNSFKIKNNKSLFILFAALLTTQATSGYLAFAALTSYLVLREIHGLKKYVYLVLALSAFLYAFFTFEFMYEKIDTLYEQGVERDIESEKSARVDSERTTYSAGRFTGFIIGWRDFKNYPVFGIGGESDLSSGRSKGKGFFIVNGLASIMSTYGAFGVIVYLLFLYKSSLLIANYYRSKHVHGFFITIMISSFAFSLHGMVMLFVLIFSSLFLCINHKTIKTNRL